jgi:hypothetical protein
MSSFFLLRWGLENFFAWAGLELRSPLNFVMFIVFISSFQLVMISSLVLSKYSQLYTHFFRESSKTVKATGLTKPASILGLYIFCRGQWLSWCFMLASYGPHSSGHTSSHYKPREDKESVVMNSQLKYQSAFCFCFCFSFDDFGN